MRSGPRGPARDLPVVVLLHTSDIHLTENPASIGSLAGVVDVAVERQVDVVLIAGDLFDHSRVGTATGERAVEQLARLDRPVVVIPGNHDQVDEQSIYRDVDLESAGPHVTFVGDPGGRHVTFEQHRLAIWARGIEDHNPGHRPLEGYRSAGPGYWNVVLTHGHYVPDGEDSGRSSPIAAADIGQLGCDYVALGHWHRYLDVSVGDVPAYYSGAPTGPGGQPEGVSLVTLDPRDGVRVERVPVAPLRD